MLRTSNLQRLVGAALIVLTVGCASLPPRELVQRNDHAGLTAWYQEEARDLRMRAEEMRQMGGLLRKIHA
jgi:hypothetical protein